MLAEYKARILNEFVAQKAIETVIDYGCGDGNQLRLASYPDYTGYDVSQNAISLCREIFAHDVTKRFKLIRDYSGEIARLTISLDVIYHLVEDKIFEDYMNRLFDSAQAYVIIYSSNSDDQKEGKHPMLGIAGSQTGSGGTSPNGGFTVTCRTHTHLPAT